ncbi:hypothetical protein MMC17_008134 [Xylographa soralifera]|nr:hypothetical protein [Xylographa soralifera]
MSYLPQPLRPIHQAIQIPIEAVEDYDGGPLSSYPERKGWHNKTVFEWISIFLAPPKPFRAFLETWLFLGVLQQVFPFHHRQPIKISDICTVLQDSDRTRVVDAVKIRGLIKSWLMNEGYDSSPVSTNQEYFSTVHAFEKLQLLHEFDLDHLAQYGENFLSSRVSLRECISYGAVCGNPLNPAMTLLISLLHEFCSVTAMIKPPVQMEKLRVAYTYSSKKLRRWNSLIPLRMRADGWCPFQISVLHEKFDAPTLCFVSDFEKPSPDITHSCIRIRRLHENTDHVKGFLPQSDSNDVCTTFKCARIALNPKGYRTKHVEGCYGCQDIVASGEELYSILFHDKTFPLVLSIDEGDDSSVVKFVKYSPGISYVAISHVWSDGLGNLERNSVPRCQMLRLSSLVRKLPGKSSGCVRFWLDTLCIPPDPPVDDKEKQEETQAAQNIAIGFMRQTYKNASAVLVLDSWLMKHCVEGRSTAEILIRILSSNWNTRLWTFQEGALAREILFQFADVAFDAGVGIRRLVDEKDAMLDYTFKSGIVHGFQDFRSLAWDKRASLSITGLMRSLRARSTSVASDEAICIAALLNVDISKVLAVDASEPLERMRVVWSLAVEVPSRIIFYLVRTLDATGYRWAPRSLLRPSSPSETIYVSDPQIPRYHHLDMGKRTINGLEVQYPGLCIWFYGKNLTISNPVDPICFRDDGHFYLLKHLRPLLNSTGGNKGLLMSHHPDFRPFFSTTPSLQLDYLKLLQAFAIPSHASSPSALVTDPLLAHYPAFIITEIPSREIPKGNSCSAIFAVQADNRARPDTAIGSMNVRKVHLAYIHYLGDRDDAMGFLRALTRVDGYIDDNYGFISKDAYSIYPIHWAATVGGREKLWRVD